MCQCYISVGSCKSTLFPIEKIFNKSNRKTFGKGGGGNNTIIISAVFFTSVVLSKKEFQNKNKIKYNQPTNTVQKQLTDQYHDL